MYSLDKCREFLKEINFKINTNDKVKTNTFYFDKKVEHWVDLKSIVKKLNNGLYDLNHHDVIIYNLLFNNKEKLQEDKWVAKWTGEYPNLCCGEWVLYKNGRKVNTNIPFQHKPAGTFKEYCHNYFDHEYWTDKIEYYYDGIGCKKWITKYQVWLKTIAPKNEWRYIYNAFKKEDWRYESCGGCV